MKMPERDWPLWIVGMLHNTARNRFHPITFRHSPTPSDDLAGSFSRYKSGVHHTDGFIDQAEAAEFIRGAWYFQELPQCVIKIEKCFAWDGEGVPAMVFFFDRTGAPGF